MFGVNIRSGEGGGGSRFLVLDFVRITFLCGSLGHGCGDPTFVINFDVVLGRNVACSGLLQREGEIELVMLENMNKLKSPQPT